MPRTVYTAFCGCEFNHRENAELHEQGVFRKLRLAMVTRPTSEAIGYLEAMKNNGLCEVLIEMEIDSEAEAEARARPKSES